MTPLIAGADVLPLLAAPRTAFASTSMTNRWLNRAVDRSNHFSVRSSPCASTAPECALNIALVEIAVLNCRFEKGSSCGVPKRSLYVSPGSG